MLGAATYLPLLPFWTQLQLPGCQLPLAVYSQPHARYSPIATRQLQQALGSYSLAGCCYLHDKLLVSLEHTSTVYVTNVYMYRTSAAVYSQPPFSCSPAGIQVSTWWILTYCTWCCYLPGSLSTIGNYNLPDIYLPSICLVDIHLLGTAGIHSPAGGCYLPRTRATCLLCTAYHPVAACLLGTAITTCQEHLPGAGSVQKSR